MQTVRKILDAAPKKAQTQGSSMTEKGGDSGGSVMPGETVGKVGEGALEKGGKVEVKTEGEATMDVPGAGEGASVQSNGVCEEAATTETSKPVPAGVDHDPVAAATTPEDPKPATGSEGQ